MDSYRVEKRAVQQILLLDENAEIEPVPPSGGGHVPEPELERLSSILREFNDLFGAIAWQDTDRVKEDDHGDHSFSSRPGRCVQERSPELRSGQCSH